MPKIVDHDTRRREIVEASWQVIAGEGLDGVTMRKIAAAADCTTGRLTHYFANREELVLAALRAVYDAAASRMAVARAADGTPRQRLLRMLEETLPLDDARLREWKIWIAFWGAAAADRTLAKENDDRHDRWRASILPFIREIAPSADAAYEAERLVGIVNGLGLEAAINPTSRNRTRVRETLARHLESVA
ncbi:TetR/AcrR family transcriptional regulator [Parvibaculum sp.]|jgi:AcrR family transcriptional regulator|uniref:TetR/AcrR family transcriptional regulator n=1 Tax=Parvibaculum sp. TaxID=2024848 RepID=UPI002FDA87ED